MCTTETVKAEIKQKRQQIKELKKKLRAMKKLMREDKDKGDRITLGK